MTSTREGGIAETILQMRNPLARVALAASQLAREASTPAARELACGIGEAVVRIDEGIEDSLRALRRDGRTARAPVDCRDVLEAIRERMTPVLHAHGVRWDVGSGGAVPEPVMADRDAAEQGALALLRAGIALAGARGRVALSFANPDEREGNGIVLEVEPGPDVATAAEDLFAEPHRLALRLGGSIDLQPSGRIIRAVLRFGEAGLV